jgi:hypothetical protein
MGALAPSARLSDTSMGVLAPFLMGELTSSAKLSDGADG